MDHFAITRSLGLIGWILATFILSVGSLRCYQCTTVWDMGCWYKWDTIQPPSLEAKHLRVCPELDGPVTSCVKEYFQHKHLSDHHYGFNPYVRRRCAGKIERKPLLPDSCNKEVVGVGVGNDTLRVEQTTCYCSTDNCNLGYRLHHPDWYFLASSAPFLLTRLPLS